MHHWLRTRQVARAIFCVGALIAAPFFATATETPVWSNGERSFTAQAEAAEAEPTSASVQPRLYDRTVAWWPYTSGPLYGNVPTEEIREGDVLRLAVGSFRTDGFGLNIPAELTGSLSGLSQGLAQYFLVQLEGNDPGATRRALESLGAVVVDTMPVNGLVVRLDSAAYSSVAASGGVRFIEPYHPAFRLHPNLGTMPQRSPEAAASPIFDLEVELFAGEPVDRIRDLIAGLGAQIDEVIPVGANKFALHVRANAALVPELAKLEPVAMISERSPIMLHASRGALFLQSEGATPGDYPYWRAGLDGDNQIIQVTDSGLSVDAGDFANTRASSGWDAAQFCRVGSGHRKVVCYRPASDYPGGSGDFEACDSADSGAFTHGQIVAGVAAGGATRDEVPAPPNPSPSPGYGDGFFFDDDNDGEFNEFNDDGYDGIAKGARVVFIDAASGCPDNESPELFPGNLNSTIAGTWTDYDANIHNFSFGSLAGPTGPTYTIGADDIDTAVINDPINFVAISAGNEGAAEDNGLGIGSISNQASCKNCVAVGASRDTNGNHWSFTSTGYGPDRRVAPLLFAEGWDNACRSEDGPGLEDQTGGATCPDSGLRTGTSFASPNLAGAAAVIRDYFAKGFYPDGTDNNDTNEFDQVPTISAALIKAVMIGGAQPIVAGRPLTPDDRFNNIWGYGQIFLTRSLPLSDAPQTVSGLIVHDQPGDIDKTPGADGVSSLSLPGSAATTVGLVGSDTFEVREPTDDLVVALVWNDPPNTSGAVSNDLDLEVAFCGADATDCSSPVNVWQGNIFGEDPDRDGTPEFQLDPIGPVGPNSAQEGYWYTIDNNSLIRTGETPADYRDATNNTEAVFIAQEDNAQDLDADGTEDIATLEQGLYEIRIFRRSGTDEVDIAVAITGPVAAGSSVRFDRNPYACNSDAGITVNELADGGDPLCPDTSNCPASVISDRVSVSSIDDLGAVVDTVTGISFDKDGLRFTSSRPVPLTYVGEPVAGDDVLFVSDGYRLEVTYADNAGTRVSNSELDCRPQLLVDNIRQLGKDFPFVLDGGCDGDNFLDEGEFFTIVAEFIQADTIDLIDAVLELRAVVPDGDNEADSCRTNNTPHPNIAIETNSRDIGLLPAQLLQQSSFAFEVVGTPAPRDQVELVFALTGAKTGQPFEDCVAFSLLMQADEEVNRYITDCPTGCVLDYDINWDEKLEDRVANNPFDVFNILNRGFDESQVVYGDMTSTVGRTETDCPDCGNPGFDGPWDFDTTDNGFRSGISPRSALALAQPEPIINWGEDENFDGIVDGGEEKDGIPGNSAQGWNLLGGCGWASSDGTSRGIWHTGEPGPWASNHNTINCRPDDSICEEYDVMGGTTGLEYWLEFLRTPVIHPVRSGIDQTSGFEWRTQVVDWSWNQQLDIADGNTTWIWEFDLDVENDTPVRLGDDVIFLGAASQFGNELGLISGGQLSIHGGGYAFAPTTRLPGSIGWADSANGTIGNNRAGQRGCYFNNLDTIETSDAPNAGFRRVRSALPLDDDCDNDFDLGDDGCPGFCGVDDDGNGAVDDLAEICPCRVCESASPRAGERCFINSDCNLTPDSTFACVSNTNGAGVPANYGDDVCGDGATDENVSAEFGDDSNLRQTRNMSIAAVNGVAQSGTPVGDPRFNSLEDFAPAGTGWQAELGWLVAEPGPDDDESVPSYGMGVDDMVIEWAEFHPIGQTAQACATGTDIGDGRQCASISLGVSFNTNDGDSFLPVIVTDWNAATTENAVDCNGDGQANEVLLEAFSEAERTPEEYCLERTSPGGAEYRGLIRTSTSIRAIGDGIVYLAFNANDTPSITARYFDRNDGVTGFGPGPDGQPGIAGFDDDGDGVVDNIEEQCPTKTQLAAGRSPHNPGQPARYSDDLCGCPDNPIVDGTFAAFSPVDVVLVDYTIIDDCPTCDNDSYADPGEEVRVEVEVRNLSGFPLDDTELLFFTESDLVDCVTDDRIVLGTIAANDELDGGADEVNSASVGESFSFIVADGRDRTSSDERFGSDWFLSLRATGRGGLGSTLDDDVEISGTFFAQDLFIPHNLDAPGATPAADYFEDFEGFANDQELRNTFLVRVTGDDEAELDGTRCQANDPANPFGNNTSPEDFCQLGEGFDNNEEHWHLRRSSPVGSGTVCGDVSCPDFRSRPGGVASLSNTNTEEAFSFFGADDGNTIDINRMNWVQINRNFQMGLENPTLEFWTMLSILDDRLFGGGGFAFDAAGVYVCVDSNDNDECDTGEQPSGLDAGENWERITSWFSPPQNFRQNNFINCMYDPSDDGTTEDDLFENTLDQGPSSTCFPGNPVDTCLGKTREADDTVIPGFIALQPYCFPETGSEAESVPGADGTPGRWINKRYNLTEYRGQKLLFRWHVSPGGLPGFDNIAQAVLNTNADDGWFIDDIRIGGLANPFSLSVDNTGDPNDTCPTLATCTAVEPKLAVLPYPRNDVNGDPLPALGCSPTAPGEEDTCDFDKDGVVDATELDIAASAAGKAYFLTATFSEVDKCLTGALEYRFTDQTQGVVVRDWLTDPVYLANPLETTTYLVEARCSADTGCIDSLTTTITVSGGGCDLIGDLTLASDKQTITWSEPAGNACPAIFDTLKGDAGVWDSGTCLENDGADTQSTDTGTPVVGEAFWYLARPDGLSWSSGGAGEQDRSGITGCP